MTSNLETAARRITSSAAGLALPVVVALTISGGPVQAQSYIPVAPVGTPAPANSCASFVPRVTTDTPDDLVARRQAQIARRYGDTAGAASIERSIIERQEAAERLNAADLRAACGGCRYIPQHLTTDTDADRVTHAKATVLRNSGILELVNSANAMDQGIQNRQLWAAQMNAAERAAACGASAP